MRGTIPLKLQITALHRPNRLLRLLADDVTHSEILRHGGILALA